jgi:hypothetical protein
MKGFPQGEIMSITRIPDIRAKDSQHNKTRIYWADNLPSAIGARTILTLTDRPAKTTFYQQTRNSTKMK